MTDTHLRHIAFDFVHNLRDLGGYHARDGRRVAWRRLYRSGELRHRTTDDLSRLQEETGLVCVLDLRNDVEIKGDRVGLIPEAGIRYHNIPVLADPGKDNTDDDFPPDFTSMGQFYVMILEDEAFRHGLIKALELIAAPENHPLLFHCTIGKDRTGMLSAIVLSLLGVEDEDIINDYVMTAPSMAEFVNRIKSNPETARVIENLPAFFWEAASASMSMFLSGIRRNHGSVRGYIASCGGDDSLVKCLEDALLD